MMSWMIGWSLNRKHLARNDRIASGAPRTGLPPYRFQSIQSLRAIAAIMVVVYHMVHAEVVHGGGVSLLGGPAHFGYAGVDVFFVISGFIMATVAAGNFGSTPAALNFLFRRAMRIFPLYWLCTLVVIVLLLVRPASLDAAFFEKGLVRSLLLLPQEDGPLLVVGWTLTFELFFYTMTAVALAFGSSRRASTMILAWAAVLVLVLLLATPANGPWWRLLTSPLTLEFLAGAWVGVHWRKLPDILAWPAAAIGVAWMVAASLLLSELPGYGQSDGVRVIAFGLPAALLIAGLAHMEGSGRILPKGPMVRLGDASYSLYLTHLFVLSLSGRLWSALGATGSVAGNLVFLIITLLLCLVVSVVVHRTIELPIARFSNRAWRVIVRRVSTV